jgi:two-component system response regulator AtoC
MHRDDVIAFSPAMREAVGAALDVAPAPTTVLLTGESGAGKEVVARFIHTMSPRAALPLTVVACAGFDAAAVHAALEHGGTVVLDEVSALTREAQAQLLRLLEGAHASRVIATSNRDLAEQVERGALRSDLFYRLDVYPVHVPALRERREDIGALTDTLLTRIAYGLGRTPAKITGSALAAIELHDWPGNVRELANVLERAVIRARTPLLEASDLALQEPRNCASPFPSSLPLDLAQLERLAIAEALRRTGGNRTHAAKLLNIGLRTLRQKLNGPMRADVTNQTDAGEQTFSGGSGGSGSEKAVHLQE